MFWFDGLSGHTIDGKNYLPLKKANSDAAFASPSMSGKSRSVFMPAATKMTIKSG